MHICNFILPYTEIIHKTEEDKMPYKKKEKDIQTKTHTQIYIYKCTQNTDTYIYTHTFKERHIDTPFDRHKHTGR